MSTVLKNTVIPLYFNSKDRLDISDSTANYTIRLRKTLHNISSLEVSNVGIPKTYTNIGINNDTLLMIFCDQGTEQQITIKVSNKEYTKDELANELETVLNSNDVFLALGPMVWTVEYDPIINRFSISAVYPNGALSNEWGVDIIFTAMVDVLGIGSGGTTTQRFRAKATDKLIIDTNRAANLVNNININITSTTLTADTNTSYIKSLGKSFNIDDDNSVLCLISDKTFTNFQRNIPLGTGSLGNVRIGCEIDVSQDGNLIVVGAFLDNGKVGSAAVFKRIQNGTVWIQRVTKLEPTGHIGTALAGRSVSISADGVTIAVGGPYDNSEGGDNGADNGAVWIYVQSGIDEWSLQDKILREPGALGMLGRSVALSADGNVLATGGSGGWVRIYRRTGVLWSHDATLTASGLISGSGGLWFGLRCGISNDGTRVFFAARGDSNKGAIVFYWYNGTSWVQKSILRPIDAIGTSNMGEEMSVSGDGMWVAGAAPADNANNGAVFLFRIDEPVPGTFTVAPQATKRDASHTKYGTYVALNTDGSSLAIGTGDEPTTTTGRAVILSGGAPDYPNKDIIQWPGTEAAPHFPSFGSSIGIDGSGTVVAVGAETHLNTTGSMLVYEKPGAAWEYIQGPTLFNDYVGESAQTDNLDISSDGNVMVVGGWKDNVRIGAGWIYYRDGKSWVQFHDKLVSPTVSGIAGIPPKIGMGVGISGDGRIFALGAPEAAVYVGRVIVYTWNPILRIAAPIEHLILEPLPVVGSPRFGHSISISTDGFTMAVGAPGGNGQAGEIWVYTDPNGVANYAIQDKLTGTSQSLTHNMGIDCALSGDGNVLVAVGQGTSGNNSRLGVWIFTRDSLISGIWTETQLFVKGVGGSGIGSNDPTVDIDDSGDTIIIGFPTLYDGGVVTTGAFYIYHRVGLVWVEQSVPAVTGQIVGLSFGGKTINRLGTSVAITPNGKIAVIGDEIDNNFAGVIYVYERGTGDVWNQIERIVPDTSFNLRSVGASASLGTLPDNQWALVSGTKFRGGFYRFSKVNATEKIQISLENRAYTIFDLVNEIEKKLTFDDISYEVVFDEVAETIVITSIDNDTVTSTFVVDPSSTLDIEFSGTVPSISQTSDVIDFTINNNIIKQVNSHEDESGIIIYDTNTNVLFRKYRAGFSIKDTDIIDIQLRDERDRIIDLNNADWIMTVYATIHD